MDLKGALVTPTGVLKATSWKGPAILPRGNQPRSPPFLPDGHSEYSAAIYSTKNRAQYEYTLLKFRRNAVMRIYE